MWHRVYIVFYHSLYLSHTLIIDSPLREGTLKGIWLSLLWCACTVMDAQQDLSAGDVHAQAAALHSRLTSPGYLPDTAHLAQALALGNALFKDREMDAALTLLNTVDRLIPKYTDASPLVLGGIYHRLGTVHYYLDDYTGAAFALRRAVARRSESAARDTYALATSHYSLAVVLEYADDPNGAITSLLAALELYTQLGREDKVVRCYRLLGNIYNDLGDHEQALRYLDLAFAFYQKWDDPEDLSDIHTRLGNTYADLRLPDRAIGQYQRALAYAAQLDDDANSTDIWINLVGQYVETEAYDRATSMHRREARQRLQHATYDSRLVHLNNIARAYGETNRLGEAASVFGEIISLADSVSTRIGLPRVVAAYTNFGRAHFLQGDLDKALDLHHEAMVRMLPDADIPTPYHAPTFYPNTTIIGRKERLLDVLSNKAETLRNTPSRLAQEAAIAHFEAIDQLLQLMYTEQSARDSRLFWADRLLPVYEQAIGVCHTLHTATPHERIWLEKAFAFSERSKATLLLSDMKEQQARQAADLPQGLLDTIEQLDARRIALQEQLYFDIESTTLEQAQSWRASLLAVEREQARIVQLLEAEHHSYYRLRNDATIVALSSVQTGLGSDEAIVSYFTGDTLSFAFVITADSMALYRLQLPYDMAARVREFHESMYAYFATAQPSAALYDVLNVAYTEQAIAFYRLLIEPLGSLPERLTIVPDGSLGYIPFDALLSERPEQVGQFKQYAYLLRSHAISYVYSATLLQEMRRHKPESRRGVLAIAPVFGKELTENAQPIRKLTMRNADGSFAPLRHNTSEAEAICDMTGGTILAGSAATLQRFSEIAEGYNVLHFATHGKMDDNNAGYSFLAFYQDSIKDNLLYVNDLYKYQLNADLVVLSACETGIGKLHRGEGIASLARGFASAGASSVVTTLWSINDKKTAHLMQNFYQNLLAGATKDAALRKSKLNLVNNGTHVSAHPFYWAAVIPVGDMRAIDIKHNSSHLVWWGMLGLMVVATLLYLFWRNRKSSR